MNNNRIIIVSNRLPFQMVEKNGKITFTQSTGGLVSSMISYFQGTDKGSFSNKAQWVGVSDITEQKFLELKKEDKIHNENFDLNTVHIPDSINNKFYNGFCNNTIWPLFHYFPSYAKFESEDYESYVTANKLFCEKILQIYQPGDLIWIHDYHLMLLPELLRAELPEATIGFCLHIPFPSFELFRILPSKWKVELLNGLLGSDLVGFHTNDYMQHFLKSVQQILGYDVSLRKIMVGDRSVLVDTNPVSIDFNKFYTSSNSKEVYEEKNRIKKQAEGKQIIISIDRLDYAKSIPKRLEGYEEFLNKFPSYKGKVTYILVVVPSRDIITKYKENKKEIELLVSGINGKYGSLDWTPIVYQYKSIDFTKLAALYFAADVALITPLRDGMNLVAKEFVSTRLDKRGVLILSETAGAASELAEAIIVNPTDKHQISESIHKALTMPVEEQMSRNEIMQNRIRNYDVVKWVDDFVSQLSSQKAMQENLKIKLITPQIEFFILDKYNTAQQRLLLLDYDGTLTGFTKFPQQAVPSFELLRLLDSLANDGNNRVVIISGRTREVLEMWFKDTPIDLIAEHGGFCKPKGKEWHPLTKSKVDWKQNVYPIVNFHQSRCAGSFIEEKELSIAWHYRNTIKEFGFLRSRELINELKELAQSSDFQIIDGNMVVEIRANGVNKGIATKSLLDQHTYDFIMAIGDDVTDEDMFKVIPETGYSIRVGLAKGHAKYNLKKQKSVVDFLARLSKNPIYN